jgi:hypothetical protein
MTSEYKITLKDWLDYFPVRLNELMQIEERTLKIKILHASLLIGCLVILATVPNWILQLLSFIGVLYSLFMISSFIYVGQEYLKLKRFECRMYQRILHGEFENAAQFSEVYEKEKLSLLNTLTITSNLREIKSSKLGS